MSRLGLTGSLYQYTSSRINRRFRFFVKLNSSFKLFDALRYEVIVWRLSEIALGMAYSLNVAITLDQLTPSSVLALLSTVFRGGEYLEYKNIHPSIYIQNTLLLR